MEKREGDVKTERQESSVVTQEIDSPWLDLRKLSHVKYLWQFSILIKS